MDKEAEKHLAYLRQKRIDMDQGRAALDELVTEFRQQLLSEGADEYVLREFELNAIELALCDVGARNADQRIKNAEGAAEA